VAFFFAATVLVILVQGGFEDDEPDATPTTTGAVATNPAGGTTTSTGPQSGGRRFYRVQAGDTLESIAAQFQTDVDVLLELNPNIDPLALSPGQRIRVRRGAA